MRTLGRSVSELDLSGEWIGDAGLRLVADDLAVDSMLRALNLSENRLEEAGLVSLGSALVVNKSLRTLLLKSNWINDRGVTGLCKGLSVNTTVTELDLGLNSFGDEGLIALAEMLCTNTSLLTLKLDGIEEATHVGGLAILKGLNSSLQAFVLSGVTLEKGSDLPAHLANCVSFSHSLTSLTLTKCKLGGGAAEQLAEALKSNTSLYTLSLALNNMGAAVAHFGETLAHNSVLTSLDLSSTWCGVNAFEEVVSRLKDNRGLESLYLSANNGSVWCSGFTTGLQSNTTLTCLDVSYNGMNLTFGESSGPTLQSRVSRLSDVLQENTTLVKLGLGGMYLGDTVDGVKFLSRLLEHNTVLSSLDISHNRLGGGDTVGAISQALKKNYTLQTVNLSGNCFREGEAQVLARALQCCSSLSGLVLRDCGLDDSAASSLLMLCHSVSCMTELDLRRNNIHDLSIVRQIDKLLSSRPKPFPVVKSVKSALCGKKRPFLALAEHLH